MTNLSQIMKNKLRPCKKKCKKLKKLKKLKLKALLGVEAVKVVINGKYLVKKIQIDPSLINQDEKEVLEDLIIAAINDANKKVSENMTQQLGSLSGGMGLPPE